MRRIEPVLRRALRGSCAVDGRIVVAVSGGADSTALLLGLSNLVFELGLDLSAAHLHHGLRGEEADADLEFVRALCGRLQVPLVAARWDTRRRMLRLGWSGQDGLRRLRRRFLIAAARRLGAVAIATAHTADDQLETLLMRLARGTGLVGLSGMSPRRGPWIRPLLDASRADVEADLRSAGERWREDASNQDPAYERNRIRHEVVPRWVRASSGPGSIEVRGELAKRVAAALREVRAARRALDHLAGNALSEATLLHGAPGRALDCVRLRTHPGPVVRHALRQAWKETGVSVGLKTSVLDRLVRLAQGSEAGSLGLPQGWRAWRARRDAVTLRIGPGGSGIEAGARSAPAPRQLRVPGRNKLGRFDLRASWVDSTMARRVLAGESHGEVFASSHLKGGLELRLGKTDEWFIPFGRRRPRRLGDFLKRSGLPAADRPSQMVLADRQGILWVIGVRRSARAPLTPKTRKALWIRART